MQKLQLRAIQIICSSPRTAAGSCLHRQKSNTQKKPKNKHRRTLFSGTERTERRGKGKKGGKEEEERRKKKEERRKKKEERRRRNLTGDGFAGDALDQRGPKEIKKEKKKGKYVKRAHTLDYTQESERDNNALGRRCDTTCEGRYGAGKCGRNGLKMWEK